MNPEGRTKLILEEAKMFTWYLATQPWRTIKESFRELFQQQVENMRALRSYKTWSVSFFAITIMFLFAHEPDKALISFLISVSFFLLGIWVSKIYRHEWKKKKIRQIKVRLGQEVKE